MAFLNGVKMIGRDLVDFPSVGRAVGYIWLRNFLYFRRTFLISLFWIFFEPLLYLFAIGYGVGHFVDNIQGDSYAVFFAPGLMATTGLLVSFFDSTYSSYTKLTRQKTFNTILLTPVDAQEIVLGEILWTTTKGLFSAVGVGLVASALGLVPGWFVGPSLLVLAILCWCSSAFGILMASYAKNYDWFMYAQSGFVIPMTLFSGTYFPLEQMQVFMQKVAYLFPLTHAVMAIRHIFHGRVDSTIFLNLAVLLAVAILLTNWAVARMRRRIVY